MDSAWIETNPGILYHRQLKEFKWLIHGFSRRRSHTGEAELSMGFNGYQSEETVTANRHRLLVELGLPDTQDLKATPPALRGSKSTRSFLVPLQQVHSNIVYRAELASLAEFPKAGDALVTREPGLLLSILTADCMPVLLVDTKKQVVAAVHAGWRGAAQHILAKTLQAMTQYFQTRPQDCLAVVGPAIGGCCYQVGPEVSTSFQEEFPHLSERFFKPDEQAPGRGWLNLPAAARLDLQQNGLPAKQIFANPPCTSCQRQNYFSHRGDQGNTGRMMALVGIRGQ
jgi:YfiH family protein